MTQLSLFGAARRAPLLQPCDPDGAVIQGVIDVTLRLPHPRLAWDLARIELHHADDGQWMWATGIAGGGYRVGPKWGKFAPTQDDAQHFGAAEILDWCDRTAGRSGGFSITAAQHRQIHDWAEALL